MGIQERVELYREMEALRGKPLLVYVTSSRAGAGGNIASDVVHELLSQLIELPVDGSDLDLLLVSNGGDPTVAWRVVSLIRERVGKFSVMVPQAAFSAATLIALGANEIVMHPHGNLGPTDPQIHAARKNGNGQTDMVPFGSEDLAAFIRFAKETVGLSDQQHIQTIFGKFCEAVGPVAIGVAARSSQLGVTMGEKLLQLHMEDDSKQKARAISEKLTRDFFHHGYPLSRTEADGIGLKVAERNPKVEALMWRIWESLAAELQLRSQFSAQIELAADPANSGFFLAQPTQQEASVAYSNIAAVMESSRLATRFVVNGMISGVRVGPQIQIVLNQTKAGWCDHWRPTAPVTTRAARAKASPKKKPVSKRPATKTARRRSSGRS